MPAPTPDQLQRFVFSEVPRDDWHKTLVDAKANTILRLGWRGVMTPSQDGVIFRVARRTTFKGRMPGVALTIEPFSPKAGKFVKPPKGYGSEMSRYRLYIRDSGRVGMAIGDLALDLKTVEMGSAPKRGKAPKKAKAPTKAKAPKKVPTAAPIKNPDVRFSVESYQGKGGNIWDYRGVFQALRKTTGDGYQAPVKIKGLGNPQGLKGELQVIANRLQELHDEVQRRAGPAPGASTKRLRAQAVVDAFRKEQEDLGSPYWKAMEAYEAKRKRGRRERALMRLSSGLDGTLLFGSVDLSEPVMRDSKIVMSETAKADFIPDPFGTFRLRMVPGRDDRVTIYGIDLPTARRLARALRDYADTLKEDGFGFYQSTGESEGNVDFAVMGMTVDGRREHAVVSSGNLQYLATKNGEVSRSKTLDSYYEPSPMDRPTISVLMTGNTLSKVTAKALAKWIDWAVEKGEKRAADWKRDQRETMQIAMAETSLERAAARRRDARTAAAKPRDRNVVPDFHRRIKNASFGPQLTDIDFVNVGRGNLKFKRGTMFVIKGQGKTIASSLPKYLRYEGLSTRVDGRGHRIAMTFSVLTPDNFTDMESVMRWTRRPGDGGVEILLADNSRVVSPALLLVGSKRFSLDEFEMSEVTLPSASKPKAKPKAKPKPVETIVDDRSPGDVENEIAEYRIEAGNISPEGYERMRDRNMQKAEETGADMMCGVCYRPLAKPALIIKTSEGDVPLGPTCARWARKMYSEEAEEKTKSADQVGLFAGIEGVVS